MKSGFSLLARGFLYFCKNCEGCSRRNSVSADANISHPHITVRFESKFARRGMIDLVESRKKIDEIDKKIVSLFKKRMLIADDVAAYKKKIGKPVFDPAREKEKLDALEAYADNDFNKTAIRELFNQIMSISRKYQYGKLAKKETVAFSELPSSAKIGFFGGRGAYTEGAMKDFFGKNVKGVPYKSFKEVCAAINSLEIDFGVLPIENSTTGGISDIYDLLVEYDNHILGEQIEKIDHALLGLKNSDFSMITDIYSHAQPILQCTSFLEANPNLNTHVYGSTAESAAKIKREGNAAHAVIASKRNAEFYALKVLAEDIANDKANSTRFIILGKEQRYLKGADKLSICFEIPHRSGSLYSLLSNFIYNNINMTNIESRPIPGKLWQYRFFVDFDGNLNDAGVLNALEGIKAESDSLTVLGNYPSANRM